jgi:hypothetical protein
MTEQEFYNRVTNSKIDLIEEFLQILHKKQIPYCVIGGIAINAYCEPVVTLDFDCVVVRERIENLKKELKRKGFKVKSHPHTWEITHKASDVRIQIQRDERYQEFISKAKSGKVLGYDMKIAQKADLLRGKLWAYKDSNRDELKRDKDLLDIKRLLRKYPELEELLTEEIKQKLR